MRRAPSARGRRGRAGSACRSRGRCIDREAHEVLVPPREAQVHAAVPADAEQLVTARAAPVRVREVVGLVFAPSVQLVGAAWREGKGVGIGVLL